MEYLAIGENEFKMELLKNYDNKYLLYFSKLNEFDNQKKFIIQYILPNKKFVIFSLEGNQPVTYVEFNSPEDLMKAVDLESFIVPFKILLQKIENNWDSIFSKPPPPPPRYNQPPPPPPRYNQPPPPPPRYNQPPPPPPRYNAYDNQTFKGEKYSTKPIISKIEKLLDENKDLVFNDTYFDNVLYNRALKLLEASKSDSLKDVKKKYIKMIRKYHPDKCIKNYNATNEIEACKKIGTLLNSAYNYVTTFISSRNNSRYGKHVRKSRKNTRR